MSATRHIRRVLTVLGVLCLIATLAIPAIARTPTPTPRSTPTPTATWSAACADFADYAYEFVTAINDSEAKFLFADPDAMSDRTLNLLTRRDAEEYAAAFESAAEALEEIDPPAVAESLHTSWIESMKVRAAFFGEWAVAGKFAAGLMYLDALEEINAELNDETDRLQRLCPGIEPSAWPDDL